jgi:hypothetical protein
MVVPELLPGHARPVLHRFDISNEGFRFACPLGGVAPERFDFVEEHALPGDFAGAIAAEFVGPFQLPLHPGPSNQHPENDQQRERLPYQPVEDSREDFEHARRLAPRDARALPRVSGVQSRAS